MFELVHAKTACARAETRAQTALLHSLHLKTQQDAELLKARHQETKKVQEDAAEAGQLLTQLTRAVQRANECVCVYGNLSECVCVSSIFFPSQGE